MAWQKKPNPKLRLLIRSALAFLVVVAFALTAFYLLALGRFDQLDGDERAGLVANGDAYSFAELSSGAVHYRLEGPAGAPVVVLIHGFSVPSFVWDQYIAPLNQAGFRVLAFDNYGRGFSDRPNVVYDAALTDRLIIELLDSLDLAEPVHLVGYSMGGATAGVFVDRHPERIRSLTLIAPAGLGENGAPVWINTPIADWVFTVLGPTIATMRLREDVPTASNPGDFISKFAGQFRYGGTSRALLSTLRHYPFASLQDEMRGIGASGLPTLIIWGEDDETVPFEYSDRFAKRIPNARLAYFPGWGHAIPYAAPNLVLDVLLAHLAVVEEE